MTLPRRKFLRLAAAVAAVPAASRAALSDTYPSRPVRWVIPVAPAGGNDIFARQMAQFLSVRLGQPFVVENRPGGGNNIGTDFVVNSAPDGYTLLFVSSNNTANSALYDNLGFDFLRDIAPVAGLARTTLVMLVNPSFPATTVPEFIAYAKANPGKVNMASAGIGGIGHLAGELFKMMTGVNLIHVPYRGNGPALTALLGGEMDVLYPSLASSIGYIKDGRLRALAVTSATRSEAMPDLPTIGESVAGYDITTWYGIGAPRKTPAEVIDKLNGAVNAGLADPALTVRFVEMGDSPMPMTPAGFGEFLAQETEKLAKVVKFAGIKLQ
ncbi:MAG: tripartite tricarboxylate transporter substrate binding protein [Xanthobacteraceae bacterium]|jgi:tripartite-type tricarboxylate transporter receptor subunit TctC